jgi:hypothetical protein
VGIHYWLYASRSTIPSEDTQRVIEDIVGVSQTKNETLQITGALVYSDLHFGQIIEGPAESIMALRSSILRDARHTNIKTIGDGRAPRRRFGQWALAFSGASMLISRVLQRAIRDADYQNPDAGEQLLAVMSEAAASLKKDVH